MPTTILDNESYPEALQRRYAEEAKAEERMAQEANRIDVLRMAREAGFVFPETQEDSFTCWWEELERFFNLAFAAGAANEREACAKVCKDIANSQFESGETETAGVLDHCAASIRSRGEKNV